MCLFKSGGVFSTEAAAIEAWNNRTPSEALPEPVGFFANINDGKTRPAKYVQVGDDYKDDHDVVPLYTSPRSAALLEPVAWMDEEGCLHTTLESAQFKRRPITPLYTSPMASPEAARVPDGWQLVPITLTKAMKHAAEHADHSDAHYFDDELDVTWKALLVAAERELLSATPPQHGECGTGARVPDTTITRLRGQLQNCVNHLERLKRHAWTSDQGALGACIESANKALYETLIKHGECGSGKN